MINVRIEVHITGPGNGDFVTMTFPLSGEKFADWAGRAEHRGDIMMACHHAGLVARDDLQQEAASAWYAARVAATAEEYVRTMRDEE